MTDFSARDRAVAEILESEHFRYRPRVHPTNAFFKIPPEATLRVEAPGTPLMQIALSNFSTFLKTCLGVTLAETTGEADIVFRVSGDGDAEESFQLEVKPSGLVVTARTERGLLQATHYLERLMADGGGPVLALGASLHEPALSPRFTEGIFIPGMQEPRNPGHFSDANLGLMSHFGANALKIYVNLFHLWRTDSLPELNSAEFTAETTALRAHAQRLAQYGLDLYLHLNTGPLDASHPVFAAHPDIRGSQVEIAVEELSGRNWYALCSSHPKVLQAYREALAAIFASVPELAGAIMIIGGECFFHCFTRPAGSGQGETNCPRCQGTDAHLNVANLVNAVALPPGKRLLAWPYSAFIWSGQDTSQSRWIDHLDAGVEVMSNFDCNDTDEAGGAGVRFFDYNIKLIGPSRVFRAQAEACHRRGLKIHVKTETNTTADAFFLPYLPLYFRWYERFRAIRESGAAGFMGQWRFYGMNGSIPEELQYHSVWNPDRSAEDLLETIAGRDFHLDEDRARGAVEAWRQLSASWDDFPYSAMTSGEREGYMRGPWYLGPAHPLIFNPQSRYSLGEKFFRLRGDLAELTSAEERAAMAGKPRYIDDLWICLPFGTEAYLGFARRCRDRWDKGLATLRQTIGQPNDRAQMELDVCETVSIHLHTLANTVEFLRLRDEVARGPQTPESLDQIWTRLEAVLASEIANSARALPVMQRDPRPGYGHAYGEVYDTAMVEEKLRQCRFVKDSELPRMRSFLRFHIWQR